MIINMKARTSTGDVCQRLEPLHTEPLQPSYDEQTQLFAKVDKTGRMIASASVFAGAMSVSSLAYAADGSGVMDGLMPLIEMLQDFALPVGIGISTWGLIEMMIGNPGGRSKIKYAVGGYAGIYLIPFLFYALRDALGGISP